MSYILEALKKAERERELGEVPRIDSALQTDAWVPPTRRRGIWIAATVIGLNLAVLGWVLFRPPAPSTPVASTPAPAMSPVSPAEPIETLPAPIPPVPHAAEMSASQPAAPAPAPAFDAPSTLTAQPAPVIETPDAPAMMNLPVPPAVSFEQVSDIPPPGLEGIAMDVHVYATQAAQRFVLINMNRYQEGQQLPEGVVVEAITPEGVILSHHGTRFRLAGP